MELSVIKGILTGIILSLPFGPVGIYCTELAIVEGRWKAYITAMGMVTIDVFYALVSLIFLTKVEDTIIKYENYFSLAIGIFLMCVAIKKLITKPVIKEMNVEIKNIIQSYFTGLFFALANITTVLIITVLFTALKVYNDESPFQICETMIGVLIGGSSLWFFTTGMVSHYGKKLDKKNLTIAIKIVNSILLVFSVIIILKSLIKFIKV